VPEVSSPRIYVLDCGTLAINSPEDFGLTRQEVADTNMPVTCFLVVHPKGTLLFDTGLSDALAGGPFYAGRVGRTTYQMKYGTLKGQLAALGVTPDNLTYLALSHSHFDHVGNANDYARATWLTQKAEYDVMFGTGSNTRLGSQYNKLGDGKKVVFEGDHDVFGDGTVILKSTPGHTPGHQSLYVMLKNTGGVLIAGDLWHYPEERSQDRMPERERRDKTPASRAAMETFMKATNAQLWIDHAMSFYRDARKPPQYYD